MGIFYILDIVGFTSNGAKINNIFASNMLVENGNLENVSLCMSFTYNYDNEMTQADIAAYCDSHAITFM